MATKICEKSSIYTFCGTIGFIAPEILNEQINSYNEQCDMFSVGAIFY